MEQRQQSEPEEIVLWDPPPQPAKPARKSVASDKRRRKGQQQPATHKPIAKVAVDISLPHLDRPFDYYVPEKLDKDAVPGCRVRVRFAGKLLDGFLLERTDTTDHQGRLAFLERVVSPEPVLCAETVDYLRAVAERYAGTLMDVVRLAIPPRHAGAEKEAPEQQEPPHRQGEAPDCSQWFKYENGAAFVEALRQQKQAHAVWQPLPGEQWPQRLAEIAAMGIAESPDGNLTENPASGSLVVLPDYRDVDRVYAACAELVGAQRVVALHSALGPAERYKRWLAISRGTARIVVGTRAAMFAPIANPGLFVVWDDGDDLHVDQHAPYPQVRDVLALRAHRQRATMLIAGFTRTAEAQLFVETGWAHPIAASRGDIRQASPRITSVSDDAELARDPQARLARLPSQAFTITRAALAVGAPVLIQVPRSGYVPALTCTKCRTPARCRQCAGPLGLAAGANNNETLSCRWCGVPEARYRCSACGSSQLRAAVIGAERTGRDLGKAFPGVPIALSKGDRVIAHVPDKPALVICTPGAEPIAENGYGAALLLDGWALLGRPDLRADEEALRRWMAAAALVRSASAGGRVMVSADGELAPVKALMRWMPQWHAERELGDRRELSFPPAVRMASLEGPADAVAEMVADMTKANSWPSSAEILGPVSLDNYGTENSDRERTLIRVRRGEGKALATALTIAQANRSLHKATQPVRVQLDPLRMV